MRETRQNLHSQVVNDKWELRVLFLQATRTKLLATRLNHLSFHKSSTSPLRLGPHQSSIVHTWVRCALNCKIRKRLDHQRIGGIPYHVRIYLLPFHDNLGYINLDAIAARNIRLCRPIFSDVQEGSETKGPDVKKSDDQKHKYRRTDQYKSLRTPSIIITKIKGDLLKLVVDHIDELSINDHASKLKIITSAQSQYYLIPTNARHPQLRQYYDLPDMYRTARAKNASSVPSDRIPPQTKGPKGKSKQKEPPRSKEVQRLEKLRDDIRGSTGRERDPRGGCFCQARTHPLSPNTPICRFCGLVLCDCSSRITLAHTISETIAREEAERERAIQAARAAAGAFPSLSAATSGPTLDPQTAHPVNQSHKVLSVNSKTKKVTVSSYTTPTPSRPASRGNTPADDTPPEEKRVPPPPPEVVFAQRPPEPLRPWANLRGNSVTYVAQPSSHAKAGPGRASKRKGTSGAGDATKTSTGKPKDTESLRDQNA
ncbi:hypothetical protein A0H81_14753 [Grifola frondosa]|uniref:TRIP4/RQT4 C2HC5-type zinc finger domain-containing protein n=1 Tax=Grifola frondosa TaxID=5627 RepID=A0A1C7LR57_GRIFR|nr:hypothetical protein A0H81_14753 [Grifola frondosa]